MKKIKSLLAKIKASLTMSTYQKPLLLTIFTLISLNIVILLVAAFIGLQIDNAGVYFSHSYAKALTSCISWLISPNSINKFDVNTDLKIMILAGVVIAVGMILFSGAIVATLTTALKSYVDKKSQAQGKIDVSNHFVILNFNSKVPEMVYNLILKDFKGNILILSNKDKDEIQNEIKSVISAHKDGIKRKVKLIVKKGNPLLQSNLEDISIEKASNICIMAREDMLDSDDDNISNSDLFSLKIMLALGNFNINKDCNIVVETDADDIRRQIDGLAKNIPSLRDKSIIPVSFNRKIGQIISQAIIDPVMSDVYLSLLSFDGCEFYSSNEKEEVEEYLTTHNNAIPIIKLHQLFVLAEDDRNMDKRREACHKTNRTLKVHEVEHNDPYTIFVIGENKKSDFILENLRRASNSSLYNFKIVYYHKNEVSKMVEDMKVKEGIKKVLILSDDSVSEDSYDANVFTTLIALQNAFPNKENISFITELLDSRNLSIIKDFEIQNAIISNSMMSLLITCLALNQKSLPFFENLLTVDVDEGGECFDIKVKYVDELIDNSENLKFANKAELVQSFYYSFDKKYMLLGYIKNGSIYYLCDNQDEPNEIKLETKDRLIYIKY